MFDWLEDLVSGSPLTYAVVSGAAAGDVILPVIPSETMVITAGVLAADGRLVIWLLLPLTALGAMLGDHVSYLLGRRIGDPVAARLFRGEAAQRRLRWAARATERHGTLVVIVARLLPGGRTAGTFAAGTLGMPYRRFLAADAVAAVLWATYATMLGYLGGTAFTGSLWRPLAVSFTLAALVALGFEVRRRMQKRRGRDFFGDPLEDEERAGAGGTGRS